MEKDIFVKSILLDGVIVSINKNIEDIYVEGDDVIVEIRKDDNSLIKITSDKIRQENDMVAISYEDFERFGCPYCGTTLKRTHSYANGTNHLSCGHEDCQKHYLVVISDLYSSMNFILESGEKYCPVVQKHPRFNIPKTNYKAKDIRPENLEHEYFNSRGVGYDLAGFVKSKEAGERIVEKIKTILNKSEIKSWLDYREYEPSRIQLKISPSEFDIVKLDDLVRQNEDVLTNEILESCKK